MISDKINNMLRMTMNHWWGENKSGK